MLQVVLVYSLGSNRRRSACGFLLFQIRRRNGELISPLSSMRSGAPFSRLLDHHFRQVKQYQDVNSQERRTKPRDFVTYLEDFPREEGDGDGQREVFAPHL